MSLDSLCRWQVQVSVYCVWRIPAHLRCTQCSILLLLMDICFLTCICLWQISQIQTFLFKVVGPGGSRWLSQENDLASPAMVLRVRCGSISSELLMCGGGVCIKTIVVCIWHMFILCLLLFALGLGSSRFPSSR